MEKKNKLDRHGDEYRALFSRYLSRGASGLSDVEARALSEGASGLGDVLFTTYSKQFMLELGDDRILGQVSKVYSSTGTFSVPIITPPNSSSSPPQGFSVQKNPGEGNTIIEATTSSQAQVVVPSFTQPGTSNTGTGTSTFTLKRISVMVKTSKELLEDSAQMEDASVENIIVRQAAQDIARELTRQILIGNKDDSVTTGTASTAGSDSCHGLVNTLKRYSRSLASSSALAATSGSLNSANGLLNGTLGLCQSERLAPHYWDRCTFVFNSKMNADNGTAGNNGISLGSGLTAAGANMILSDGKVYGRPFLFAEMSPSGFGGAGIPQSGEPLVIAADLSRYLLAFAGNGISVTRLNETFAATNEAAFIVSVRCAGALTDVNAAFGIHR